METAYDGRQVVGMDLHRRRSVLVRMTMDGRVGEHLAGRHSGPGWHPAAALARPLTR